MSSIQKVARQALVTFAGKDASRFVADFEVLRSLVSILYVLSPPINIEIFRILGPKLNCVTFSLILV